MSSSQAPLVTVRQLGGARVLLPSIVTAAGEHAARRFVEFFAAHIRNPNTRRAYARAVGRFFGWCDQNGIALDQVQPMFVGAYIEQLGQQLDKPSVKQHLAAIRMLFDFLVLGQVLPMNPSASVRGPAYSAKKGKTPVLNADEARTLLDSIPTDSLIGLRDRALIGVMLFSFARVGAVVTMNVEDYFQQGKRWWFRLHEKGGKRHEVPVHHNAEQFMDAYLEASGIRGDDRKQPLFRSFDRRRALTARRIHPNEVLAMIHRRAKRVGLPATICCHTFRATGITRYLECGGTVEKAQRIAAHESPRTTNLYDRRSDEVSLDEIERIVIFGN